MDDVTKKKFSNFEEIQRRADSADRVARHGPQKVFSRVEGQSFLFKNPEHNFFVYEISTASIPPVSTGDTLIRVSQFHSDSEMAMRFAVALNNAVSTTVFMGKLHEWHVCPDTLIDASPQPGEHERHRDALLEAHKQKINSSDYNYKVRDYIYKNLTPASVRDWCETAHIDASLIDRIVEWADMNGFTHDRIGNIDDSEAQELNVPGPHIRECYKKWLENVNDEAARAVAEKTDSNEGGPEVEPEPCDDANCDGEPEHMQVETAELQAANPTTASIPESMIDNSFKYMVISVLLDDSPRKRHVFKVYGAFQEKKEAESYVQNVAGDRVRDHNMYVVATGVWINPEHSCQVSDIMHREPELNKIMEAQKHNSEHVERLNRELQDTE